MKTLNRLRGLGTRSDLASQIRMSISKHVVFSPVEQTVVEYCRGPEEVVDVFVEAISKYPASVLRLPITAVLMELTTDSGKPLGKRKMKKVMLQVCRGVRGALGEADLVVRYGRNKLAFLLFNVSEELAGKICQRIKEAVHRYCYLVKKMKNRLCVDFAVCQHDPYGGNDFAELVFGNDHNIRIARALGDGAVVTRQDIKEHFQNHTKLLFHLGEIQSFKNFELES